MNVIETTKAVRKIIVGILMCEYGLMELGIQANDLKHRINVAIKACRTVQSYFNNNPAVTPYIKDFFKKEFGKSEQVLLTEIMEKIYGLNDSDLEIILKGLDSVIEE